MLWKFLGLEGGWGDDYFEILTLDTDVFDESENDIGVERTLVGLVDDHYWVGF